MAALTRSVAPRVRRLAELFNALPRRPSSLFVAEIDADGNELPPPYDRIKRATVAIFPACEFNSSSPQKKMTFMEWLEPEQTLGDILSTIQEQATEVHTK